MKSKLLVLLLAIAAPVFAADGHNHAEPGHKHEAKIAGPNKGRVLTELEPHAEFFVTADRKVRLTFIDDSGKAVAVPEGVSATLITGERSAPVTLTFAADGTGAAGSLLSSAVLPEGKNMPAILRVKPPGDGKAVTIRFQLNLAQCGECVHPEYACTCGH